MFTIQFKGIFLILYTQIDLPANSNVYYKYYCDDYHDDDDYYDDDSYDDDYYDYVVMMNNKYNNKYNNE